MDLIRCENLVKRYDAGDNKVFALDGVTFGVREGSLTAVIGPSGSGKSTLLQLLSGLDTATSGEVYYQDKPLKGFSDNQLAVLRRRRFGFVFQSYHLVKELTAYENILLPVMLDRRKPDEQYINRLIDLLGIGDQTGKLPAAMSGGQQQRVSVARALSNKPAVLFADEPTGNLDGKTGRELLALLREVNAELGVTLLMVTHDLTVAEQAQRVVRLLDGKIAHDSAPEAV